MTVVDLIVPVAAATAAPPKAYLETDAGLRIVLPWAPQQSTLDGLAATWAKLPRPGLRPLTIRTGEDLPSYSFSALFASLDRDQSIEPAIERLKTIARAGSRVRFAYSGIEAGWWRIDSMRVDTTARTPGNQVSRATVAFTLIADSPPPASALPSVPKAGSGGGGKAGSSWRVHVWKKSDTLRKLAKKYLGNANRWREIAKANKIKNPKKIKPGTKLRIPPKMKNDQSWQSAI